MSKTPRLLKVRLFSRQINPSLPENTNVFTPAYAIWIEQKKKLKYSCKYLNSKCFSFLSVDPDYAYGTGNGKNNCINIIKYEVNDNMRWR